MADLPISSAAALTHSTIASGDLFPVLDISASSGSKGSKITLGELTTSVNNTLLAAANIFTVNGVASTAAIGLSGAPYAGTGTTSFPLFYLNQTGATASTALNTAGTFFGINSHGSQDLINAMKDGVSVFNLTSAGVVNIGPADGSALNFSGASITGSYAGSTSNRASLFMTAGSGSSAMITTAGISANDGFIVATQGQAANTNLFGGFASNTAFTFNVRPAAKDFFGGYTGAGHVLALTGGAAASASTGGAGGNVTLTGGAAAGSGNNNGGDVIITGGAKTGSGTEGLVKISSLPTSNPGPGILWNNTGIPAIGT